MVTDRVAVAAEYAQAVFDTAIEKGELDMWRADLNIIAATVREPTLAGILRSANLSPNQKMEAVSLRLVKVGTLALNFVRLLIEQDRMECIDEIVSEYERLLDAHYLGVEYVEVTSAIPLEKEHEERIARRLAEIRGKQIRLNTQTDPNILGGLIIRIGDRVIDGSVRSKLLELKQSLSGGIRLRER